MEKKRINLKDHTGIIIGLSVFAVMFAFGIYRCPLNFLFGIPCPLCGMTRAFMALAKGDIAGAFYYHPLWPLAIPTAVFFVLNYLELIHPSERAFHIICGLLEATLLICFIVRHIMHSPVVAIHFSSSLIGWLFRVISAHV